MHLHTAPHVHNQPCGGGTERGAASAAAQVTKAFDVSIDRTRFPFIKLKDRNSYSHSETKR